MNTENFKDFESITRVKITGKKKKMRLNWLIKRRIKTMKRSFQMRMSEDYKTLSLRGYCKMMGWRKKHGK